MLERHATKVSVRRPCSLCHVARVKAAVLLGGAGLMDAAFKYAEADGMCSEESYKFKARRGRKHVHRHRHRHPGLCFLTSPCVHHREAGLRRAGEDGG